MTEQANMDNRRHQIFPALTQTQFEVLSRYGDSRDYAAGTVLFSQGDRHVPMFVIVEGTIEVSRGTALGTYVMGTHGPGNFSGEVGTLAGRAAVATGRALTACRVLVIGEAALRTLVTVEAELSEIIMRAYILRRVAFIEDQAGGLILIGSTSDPDTLALREFLARNGHPAAYFDVAEHAESTALAARFGVTGADIPVVITPDGTVLRRPGIRALADAVGISPDALHGQSFDLVVVGAGPGGLAAAVYAASEGLRVAVLERKAPGGQAGSSSKIENYFGFPTGISGLGLAGRGLSQARKFGVEVAVPVCATGIECGKSTGGHDIALDNGERVHAATVVISTGARYRKPDLPELARFEGRGAYYSAAFMEASLCAGEEAIVVGGGNSAGQAAVFLSRHARRVHIVVRGAGLAASMSHYLIQRINAAPNIVLHTHTRIAALDGDTHLERVTLLSNANTTSSLPICHVFLFLGAEPNTHWLDDCVALDRNGFIVTGPDLPSGAWTLGRPPHFLETSRPGIFAVGDVRSGSVKRVAAAVGEGAAAVQSLHQVLAG
jgi:thioredoxin reductase (NADPH)